MEFSFLHRPKPHQFEYKPRFYKGDSEDSSKKNLSDTEQFEQRLHDSLNRHRNAKPASSPWRTIIGAVACLALVLYFICSDMIDNLAKFFTAPQQNQTDNYFDPQAGFAEEFDTTNVTTDTTTGVYL